MKTKAKSYDVLEKGLNWTAEDGTERREEPGAKGVKDLPPTSIPEMVKSGLISPSATRSARRAAKAQETKGDATKPQGKTAASEKGSPLVADHSVSLPASANAGRSAKSTRKR